MKNMVNDNEKQALKLINLVFGTHLSEADYDNSVKAVLVWDSFMITSLLAVVMEKYNRKVCLEKILNVRTLSDLVAIISDTIS